MRLPILSFCDFRSISVDTAAHCIYVCNKRHKNRTRNKDMGAVSQTFRELSKIISRKYTMLEITSGRCCWYAVMGIVSLHFGLAVWYNWHGRWQQVQAHSFSLKFSPISTMPITAYQQYLPDVVTGSCELSKLDTVIGDLLGPALENGLLPDGTKPLPEQPLTFKRCPVAFTWKYQLNL